MTRWLSEDEQQVWRAFLGANKLVFEQLDRELQRVRPLGQVDAVEQALRRSGLEPGRLVLKVNAPTVMSDDERAGRPRRWDFGRSSGCALADGERRRRRSGRRRDAGH